jgi:hypothetical protein
MTRAALFFSALLTPAAGAAVAAETGKTLWYTHQVSAEGWDRALAAGGTYDLSFR